MAMTPEQTEEVILGFRAATDFGGDFEAQFDDPQSHLSRIAARLTRAAKLFADPDGPLFGVVAPRLSAKFADVDAMNLEVGKATRAQDWQEAYRLRLDTCRLWLRYLGEDHPQTMTAINHLGRILYEIGDFQSSIQVYERAIYLRSKYSGERHTDTSISLAGYGRVLEAICDYETARDCHREALDIMEEQLGPNHPDTGVSLTDLGCVSMTLGDFVTAKKCFERASEISRDIDGQTDPNYAISMVHLGSVHEALGDLGTAESNYEEALMTFQYAYDEDHSDMAWGLDYLAAAKLQRGAIDEARDDIQRAIEMLDYVPHPPLLRVSLFNNLAASWLKEDDFAAAESAYRHALEDCKLVLGEEHAATLMLQRNLELVIAERELRLSAPTQSLIRFQTTHLPINGQSMVFFQLIAAA